MRYALVSLVGFLLVLSFVHCRMVIEVWDTDFGDSSRQFYMEYALLLSDFVSQGGNQADEQHFYKKCLPFHRSAHGE